MFKSGTLITTPIKSSVTPKVGSPTIVSPKIQSPSHGSNHNLPKSPTLTTMSRSIQTSQQNIKQNKPRDQPTPQEIRNQTHINKLATQHSEVYEGKLYTTDELTEILRGHVLIEPEYWDHIPHGSKIKYFRKKEGDEPKNKRFRFGGYVKSHTCTDGVKRILWSKSFQKKGEIVSVKYSDIEEIWKEYDYGAKLELLLISNSLKEQNTKIAQMDERIKKLDELIRIMYKK